MNPTAVLIKLVVRTLPEPLRPRYREEWLADLADAPEIGLSRWTVLAGAVSFAVRLDRDDASVTGISAAEASVRRAHWAAALLSAALILAFGVFRSTLWGSAPLVSGGALVVAELAIAAFAVLGALWGSAAIRIGRSAHGTRQVLKIALNGAAAALTLTTVAVLPFYGTMVTIALLAAVLLQNVGGGAPATVRSRRRLGGAGAGLLLAVLAVGVLHNLVWNPLAKLPGMSLDQIYAGIAAAGQASGVFEITVWAALFVMLAAGFAVCCVRGWPSWARSARGIVVAGAMLIAAAAASQGLPGFMAELSLADVFYIAGGDSAISGVVLDGVALLAVIVAVFAAFVPAPRTVPELAAP